MSREWWNEVMSTLECYLYDTEGVELNPTQESAVGAIMMLYEGIGSYMGKYYSDFDNTKDR